MTRCTALTIALGAAAIVMVARKSSAVQHTERPVTQIASADSSESETTRSGYIIASS